MSYSLKALGMTDAFNQRMADFNRMGTSPEGPLFISEVLHKAYIAIDERGTRAGAATAVIMAPGAAPQQEPPKIVRLDRPFVYAIIDNATSLPIFIGTVMSV
jgi:serpin B